MSLRSPARFLLIVVGYCLAASSGLAQTAGTPLQCVVNSGVPPLLRAEGLTELAGDVVVSCMGGTAGQTVSANLQFYINTNITSTKTSPTQSEALLIVDELQGPHAAMYQATTGTQMNTVAWTGIPIAVPGQNGMRTLRITNIRVNAAGLGASSSLIPTQVVSFVSITPPGIMPIDNPQQVIGYVQTGSAATVGNCAGGGIAQPVTPGTMHYAVRFAEGFQTAFKNRQTSNQRTAPIGSVFNTESGFMRNPPALPAEVGLADTGTRLMARFTNLPPGARLYVTTVPAAGSSAGLTAALMPADANGAIPLSGSTTPIAASTSLTCPATGGPVAAAEIPVVNGSADAVWEITDASPSVNEVALFGFAVAAPGTTHYLPAVSAGLAPVYTAAEGIMSETLPVPRFVSWGAITRKPDVFWQTDTTGYTTVWHMGGDFGTSLTAWNWLTTATGWEIVASADFNQDGIRDLVWQDKVSRQISIWFMGGSQNDTLSASSIIGVVPGWTIAGAADFNADGKPDLVLQNDSTRQATIWYMGGAGGTSITGWTWLHTTGIPGWKIAAIADFDGDLKPDLVWQNDATRAASLWYMTGAQGTTMASWTWLSFSGIPGWTIVGAANFDAGTTPDVVWQNDTTRQATLWFMNPAGTVGSWTWLTSSSNPGWGIAAVH